MSTPAPKATKRARPANVGTIYRGVRLAPIGGRTRFSIDQIRRAVAAAIEKNADVLARGA